MRWQIKIGASSRLRSEAVMMTRDELRQALGREPGSMDQPPGLYTDKRIGKTPIALRKGPPVKAVQLFYDDPYWYCVVNGELEKGSGVTDPMDIPFVLWNAPFWPATPEVFAEVMRLAKDALITQENEP